MALTFVDNVNTDKITFTTGVIGDIGTLALWVKIASIANKWRAIAGEGRDATGWGGLIQRNADGTTFRFDLITSGADLYAYSNAATLVAGEWAFIAATWSIGVSANLYKGNLTTSLIDVTNTAVVGGGNHTLGADVFTIGGIIDITSCGMDVAFCTVYNSVLTLSQLRAIQYSRRIVTSGCLGHYFVGMNGAANGAICYDKSGNGRTGTQAGDLVLANDVPLGSPFGWDIGRVPYVVTAGGTIIPSVIAYYRQLNVNNCGSGVV